MIAPAIPENEKERLAALRAMRVLDTPPEERFDRVTRMARKIFGVPMSTVSLVDEDRQWFKSNAGLEDSSETDRSVSLSGHAILSEGLWVLNDARADERFRDNPLVASAHGPRIRFYAAHPLRAPGGLNVGLLCLLDTEPRTLDANQEAILRDLASIVEDELIRGMRTGT